MRDWRVLGVVIAGAVLIALLLWQTGSDLDLGSPAEAPQSFERAPIAQRALTLEIAPAAGAPPARSPDDRRLAQDAAEPNGIRVEGRVVKGMGVPVVGAEVRVVPAAEGSTNGRTDAQGRFVVWALGVDPTTYGVATVLAQDDDGRAASKPVFLSQAVGNRFDAGVLTLSSGERLDVEVASPAAGNLPAAIYVFRENADMLWLVAQGSTDERGRFHAVGLPRGAVRIVARAEGTGRASVASYLPVEPPGPVRVELPPDRTVEITIVSALTGEPVEGAVVNVIERYRYERGRGTRAYAPPLPPSVSDARGQVELRGLGPGDSLCLLVQAEGYMPISGSEALGDHVNPFVAPDATSVRVELKPTRTIRWPLTEERGALPDDGMTVRIVAQSARPGDSLPGEGRIEDGVLIATGFEPGGVRALAIEPGGRVAPLSCGRQGDEGRPTSFGAGGTISVRVRRPDGSPATGIWVVVREGGGPRVMGEPTPVDAEGIARVGPLLGRFAEVYIVNAPQALGGDRVGTADLQRPENSFDVVLRSERPARLRVTVDGVARVPEELVIELGSDENPLGGYERVPAERVEADGSVTFRWTPPPGRSSRLINVWGRGTTRFGGRLFFDASKERDALDVPLESAGALHLVIALPADGVVEPQLDRWEEASARWLPTAFRGMSTPEPRANGELVLEPLASGRYRLYDQVSGISLPPF
ncbi:MAG: carboxypeptidase-like regulatory domain-containing protein, partial [Planctomycetota bacterium]